MLEFLTETPFNILVIGDAFVSPETIKQAVTESIIPVREMKIFFWGKEDKQDFTQRQLNVERNGPDVENYADGLDEVISEIDIIITHFCPIPRRLIEKAVSLKAVFTCRGGMEHICVKALSERNIPVFNVIRNSEPVADFALGLILSLTRNIALSHKNMVNGIWQKTFPNTECLTTLSELTIGLVGLGNVGIALAKRCKALGMKMIAFDPYIHQERLEKNGLSDIKMMETLEDVFKNAEVVSLHLRLTDDNVHTIDQKYFRLMKPNSYFINTARGGLVNQNDLADALEKGYIAGAALDVFDKEPIEKNDRLLTLEHVVLTPHIAGTTVDAISKSPYLLMKEVSKAVKDGITDRIVNFGEIKL